MAIIHDDHQIDALIYNSDRNIFMSGGGAISWNASYQMSFTNPIYLNWFANRIRGAANYNAIDITSSPITIPLDSVVYVTLDDNNDGAILTPVVVAGISLPRSNDIYVIASHRDIGYAPNNPLTLRSGQFIQIGTTWNSSFGAPTTMYAGNYVGQTWTVNHNLGTTDVVITLQDNSSPRQIIYAEDIVFTNTNTVVVTYNELVTGRIIVIKGNS